MADEIAIVTGASSGIGAELARQLSARGLRVLAVARRKRRLDALSEMAKLCTQGEIGMKLMGYDSDAVKA